MIEKCIYCDEEILPEERMPPDAHGAQDIHRECLIRSIIGSVAHQKRLCRCHGKVHEDDARLSIRQNAKAAMDYFLLNQERAAKAKWN